MKKNTNWMNATTKIEEALIGVLSANKSGLNAWIEIQKNGEQEFPIKTKNPKLNKHENWTMMYGTPDNIQDLIMAEYFNETEKDLTLNYELDFNYFRCTNCNKLFKRADKFECPNCKSKDVNQDAQPIKVGSKNIYFFTHWKPKKDIPYWITDKNIKKVFVVCTNKKTLNKKQVLKNLKLFITSLKESDL